ncbi:zinc-binding dehydrogenase (plasmid) [Ensifer adhaerens]|uniref:MDR/zinc-dependent alcohol dehydrogenase-like family protein n=1 Tax=Ensifer adhaerens TaxID=106592 RepID=UPI001CBFBFFB|nr:zinc-binding dehydrogenase [Ensifer adhaerens]MBZ7927209.1 zinc-binding dehydrogenase [Ensifer adhaerens]UAX98239.1 zinc-binding dehydrogenase [Ensifer adhaerens]UAY05621.1 zinc-binding dehydrogenase [Ensifer adhaerens]UAY12999.1 zinc-binding dehydrogenase [Ensifer adhaerens]
MSLQTSEVMHAAVVTAPGQVRIETLPLPQPQRGQVRIRLEGCGVCASNLVPWEGPTWMEFPTVPGALGHEGWGIVDAVADDVTTVAVGDRVAALSYHAYATHDVADQYAVAQLPNALDGQPFPGEPLGCAFNILHRCAIKDGETVAIVGLGFLGIVLTELATAAGARVIAISRRQSSLSSAKLAGASDVIAMSDHWQIIEQVKRLTSGRLCDCVLEAVGKQWPLDLAAELTKERGRLVIAGYHQDGPRHVNLQLWNWRGLDVINAHERDPGIYMVGIRNAIDAVAAKRFAPSSLYTHEFPLRELAAALNVTRDRPEGFVKALVRCDG